jgi:hypothetical protein
VSLQNSGQRSYGAQKKAILVSTFLRKLVRTLAWISRGTSSHNLSTTRAKRKSLGPSEIRIWISDFRPLKFNFCLNPTIQIQLSGRPKSCWIISNFGGKFLKYPKFGDFAAQTTHALAQGASPQQATLVLFSHGLCRPYSCQRIRPLVSWLPPLLLLPFLPYLRPTDWHCFLSLFCPWWCPWCGLIYFCTYPFSSSSHVPLTCR